MMGNSIKTSDVRGFSYVAKGESILAGSGNNNITKYRRPINLNIGMIIFAVIFIYVLICVFMYLSTEHIVGYG